VSAGVPVYAYGRRVLPLTPDPAAVHPCGRPLLPAVVALVWRVAWWWLP
jgi:hypothetical protein